MIRKLIAFLGMAAYTAVSLAATLVVTWDNPTQYTDGSPLAASELEHIRIEYSDCVAGAFGTPAGEVIVNPQPTEAQLTVAGWGEKCVRAYAKVLPEFGGQESAPSGVVTKVVPIPVPEPPVLRTVENFVYELSTLGNGELRLAKRVGTIAFGVPCGEDVIVDRGNRRYYEVSPNLVHFTQAPNSAIVVAACERV